MAGGSELGEMSHTARRRAREQADRRTLILDRAEQLFLERGIDATTMDEIAVSCELAKGTLYRYFKTKDEVAFVTLLRATEELVADLRATLDPAVAPLDQLGRLALAYYRFSVSHPEPFRYMFVVPHASYAGRVADEFLEQLAETSRSILEIIADLLRQADAGGEVEVPDPQLSAVALWSALTGTLVVPAQGFRRSFLGEVDMEALLWEALRLFVFGLRERRAPHDR